MLLHFLAGVHGVRGSDMKIFIHEISNPVDILLCPWEKLTTITRHINRAQRYKVVYAYTV